MYVGDTIEIDTGSAVETRKIASIGTAAGYTTTFWLPLPDGPVITLPAGSTSVPFTGGGRGGFGGGGGFAVEVGQKLGIGYGATYPVVANTVEKYEVVTVTEAGKPGTYPGRRRSWSARASALSALHCRSGWGTRRPKSPPWWRGCARCCWTRPVSSPTRPLCRCSIRAGDGPSRATFGRLRATIGRGRGSAAGGGLQLRAWPGPYPRQYTARRLPRHPPVRRLRRLQEVWRLQVRRSACYAGLLLEPRAPGFLRSGQGQGADRDRGAGADCGTLRNRGAYPCQQRRREAPVRQAESKPLVADLHAWFEAQIAKLPARGPTAEAIGYALSHWDGLTRFLRTGALNLTPTVLSVP